MIETLISSKTRIKLLLKFFLNSDATAYLRGLESEFGDSSNSIRLELNRFEKAGMLRSFSKGNKKIFTANTDHPLYSEVNSIVLKYLGFDQIIETVIKRLGKVEKVYITGDFALGKNSPIIDLVFSGDIDKGYLVELVGKVEKLIKRRLRYLHYVSTKDAESYLKSTDEKNLLLWKTDVL